MEVKCEIYKAVPEDEGKGDFVSHTIVMEPSDTVLDLLTVIYQQYDPTLSFRYACGVVRCGECAMLVNGKPCMACDKAVEPVIRIEPLPRLPLIKDVVIDRRFVFDHIRRILPPASDVENILEQFESFDDETAHVMIENSIRLTTCFECLICQSSCPRYHWKSDRFPGPFGLLLLAQMKENPAQSPISDEVLEEMTADCLRCGRCVQCCPADKRPLELGLSILNLSPRNV